MGNEACKTGYNCIYARNAGTKVSCAFPTCKVTVDATKIHDEMTGEVRPRAGYRLAASK